MGTGMSRAPTAHLGFVAIERSNIVLNPLQCRKLISEPEVEGIFGGRFFARRKTERSQTVVEADINHRRSLERRQVKDHMRTGLKHTRPTLLRIMPVAM
jgi:hypothetical protein